jgi:hypothetical protein
VYSTDGTRVRSSPKQRIFTVKTAANSQANTKNQEIESRPTITLSRVISNGPDTASFSGWGPKVSGVGNLLKNWN